MIAEKTNPTEIVENRAWNCLRRGFGFDVACGQSHAIFDEIVDAKLFNEHGLFRHVFADGCYKAVAAVREGGEIVSYTLLCELNKIVRGDYRPGNIGLVGAFTREDMRGRGLASRTAKRMGAFLDASLPLTFHETAGVLCEKRVLPMFREALPLKVHSRWYPI